MELVMSVWMGITLKIKFALNVPKLAKLVINYLNVMIVFMVMINHQKNMKI